MVASEFNKCYYNYSEARELPRRRARMMKQTKAERIFKSTYFESKDHVSRWGFERGTGWTRLSTEETVSTRTLNAIDALIGSEARRLDDYERFGLRAAEENASWRMALDMVANTVANERKRIAVDNAFKRGEISFDEWLARR